jgi:hypothetical protein
MADEPKKPSAAVPEPPPALPAGPPTQFTVDASTISTAYANFCRVTGTPEELVLDFGLNTQMVPVAGEPVRLTHRLVMNYFWAKRLLNALAMAVQEHERVYGVLETDIQKRMRNPPTTAGRPGPQR